MKKIAMVMVLIVMFSFLGSVSFAQEDQSDLPTPYWDYVTRVTASIGITGNKAEVYGHVFTRMGNTEIKMALTLQQKVNGVWKKYNSWSGSDNGVCSVRKTGVTVARGYEYRAVVNATVYDENGDFVETCSDTSYTVSA